LRAVDSDISEVLSRYRSKWAWRPFNYEPGSATLAERPDLLVRQVLDRMEAAQRDPDLCMLRTSRMVQARSGLNNERSRMRFETLLENATRFSPLREDNVLLTDTLPAGLIRRILLEAGRRLSVRGHLSRAEDAAWLHEKELRAALTCNAV